MNHLLLLAQQGAQLQQSSGVLAEFFRSANNEEVLALLSVGLLLGAVVLLAAIVATANTVSTIAKRRIDATLKQDLLDRGMTVEEAIAMVRATPNSRGLSR